MTTTETVHPEDVKAAIRKAFGSLAAFEAAHGLAARSVTDVLRGKTSSRTADAIATLIGCDVHDIASLATQSTNADCSDALPAPHRLNEKVR